MPFKPHPDFNPPSNDSVIWRYTNFSKFVDLIQGSALYFSRADKLGDPFEGSYSKENIKLRPSIYKEIPDVYLRQMSSFFEGIRRHIYLNCWHISDYESYAMWNLYSRYDEGIAIQSTFRDLKMSLISPNNEVFVGKVRYADYETDLIPEGKNIMVPFLYKRKSFEHEKELRAVVLKLPEEGDRLNLSRDTPVGLNIEVDLKKLLKNVYISPLSPEWLHILVKNILNKYGFRIEVKHSALSENPVY